MQKANLYQLTNKVLVYEETDTISQSIFNSKKRLFDQAKKESNQNKIKHIQNVSKMPLPKIINKNNNKIIIPNHNINNINNNNKNIIKKINSNNSIQKCDKLSLIKKIYNYLRMENKKNFEINCNVLLINCIINKIIVKYDNIDFEYIKEYYNHRESNKIIPKKVKYYRHHMQFLEKPYFTNAYINRVIRNYSLDKLNVYLSQKKKGRKLENDNPKDENDDNKIFDASILETIENYSRTMIQGPKNEKFPLLIPFEIFKRCEHTNKKIGELPKKEQKSIITFSESEISYISKNVIDKSLIEVIKDLSEKHINQKNYKELVNFNNNAHNSNNYNGNSKSLNNRKQTKTKTVKENKQNINAIYIIKQNASELNKMEKKYNKFFLKKKDIEKFTKSNNKNNNNNKKNEEKEAINKKRVSTSTNKKNKKILFDSVYQNSISKSNSKKDNYLNNITSNKNEENKTANYPSFGLKRKNKCVLNLKKESYKIKSHATKFSDNYIMSDNSNSNSNINNMNSINKNTNSNLESTSYNSNSDNLANIFFTPKNKNQYYLIKSKYAEFSYNNSKRKQFKKNTTLTGFNNIYSNNENSQDKYKSINDATKVTNFKSKSPLNRLFTKKNENYSNKNKNSIYKKKKSVLLPELEHNSILIQSINQIFFNENKNTSPKNIGNNGNNYMRSLNSMTQSQGFGSNRRNSYQFMKLNKRANKNNFVK